MLQCTDRTVLHSPATQGLGAVVKGFPENLKLDQQHDFRQRKRHRKQQHDSARQNKFPFPIKPIVPVARCYLLAALSPLFDSKDRQQHRRPKQDQRARCRGVPLATGLAARAAPPDKRRSNNRRTQRPSAVGDVGRKRDESNRNNGTPSIVFS